MYSAAADCCVAHSQEAAEGDEPPVLRVLIMAFADITELDLLEIPRPPRSVRSALDKINMDQHGVPPGMPGPRRMRAVHDILLQRGPAASGSGAARQELQAGSLQSSESGEGANVSQQAPGVLALAAAAAEPWQQWGDGVMLQGDRAAAGASAARAVAEGEGPDAADAN